MQFRVALARILTVISSHPDLPSMENLAVDLATFLASITCPVNFPFLQIFFKKLMEVFMFLDITGIRKYSINFKIAYLSEYY